MNEHIADTATRKQCARCRAATEDPGPARRGAAASRAARAARAARGARRLRRVSCASEAGPPPAALCLQGWRTCSCRC